MRTAGERMRDEHSAWLTAAMMSGRPYPRIPTKGVSRGGYDPLRARPGGADRAAAWWRGALDRVDDA
ncbi:MAG: hypothetical protein EA378_10575 [Phycisphaerales bacterium]|nr:MAG: hypothetical protein EA378_10575 [Phycisphaerales bacterium]